MAGVIILPAVGSILTTETAKGAFTSGTASAFSAYTQVIASTAKVTSLIYVSGALLNQVNAGVTVIIQLASGAGGAEVVCGEWQGYLDSALLGGNSPFTIACTKQFAAGTRFAIRASVDGATGTLVGFGTTFSEIG